MKKSYFAILLSLFFAVSVSSVYSQITKTLEDNNQRNNNQKTGKKIKILHTESRKNDAEKLLRQLGENGFTPILFKIPEGKGQENKGFLGYKNEQDAAFARIIVGIVGDTESLMPQLIQESSPESQRAEDFVFYLYSAVKPKIRILYAKSRTSDAEKHRAELAKMGYDLELKEMTETVSESTFKDKGRIFYHRDEDAEAAEYIAGIFKDVEKLQPTQRNISNENNPPTFYFPLLTIHKVKIFYNEIRKSEAEKVAQLLNQNGFRAEIEANETSAKEHLGKIYFQQSGNQEEANRIAAILNHKDASIPTPAPRKDENWNYAIMLMAGFKSLYFNVEILPEMTSFTEDFDEDSETRLPEDRKKLIEQLPKLEFGKRAAGAALVTFRSADNKIWNGIIHHFIVQDSSGKILEISKDYAQNWSWFYLPPGTYKITADLRNIPNLPPVEVTINAHQLTEIEMGGSKNLGRVFFNRKASDEVRIRMYKSGSDEIFNGRNEDSSNYIDLPPGYYDFRYQGKGIDGELWARDVKVEAGKTIKITLTRLP